MASYQLYDFYVMKYEYDEYLVIPRTWITSMEGDRVTVALPNKITRDLVQGSRPDSLTWKTTTLILEKGFDDFSSAYDYLAQIKHHQKQSSASEEISEIRTYGLQNELNNKIPLKLILTKNQSLSALSPKPSTSKEPMKKPNPNLIILGNKVIKPASSTRVSPDIQQIKKSIPDLMPLPTPRKSMSPVVNVPTCSPAVGLVIPKSLSPAQNTPSYIGTEENKNAEENQNATLYLSMKENEKLVRKTVSPILNESFNLIAAQDETAIRNSESPAQSAPVCPPTIALAIPKSVSPFQNVPISPAVELAISKSVGPTQHVPIVPPTIELAIQKSVSPVQNVHICPPAMKRVIPKSVGPSLDTPSLISTEQNKNVEHNQNIPFYPRAEEMDGDGHGNVIRKSVSPCQNTPMYPRKEENMIHKSVNPIQNAPTFPRTKENENPVKKTMSPAQNAPFYPPAVEHKTAMLKSENPIPTLALRLGGSQNAPRTEKKENMIRKSISPAQNTSFYPRVEENENLIRKSVSPTQNASLYHPAAVDTTAMLNSVSPIPTLVLQLDGKGNGNVIRKSVISAENTPLYLRAKENKNPVCKPANPTQNASFNPLAEPDGNGHLIRKSGNATHNTTLRLPPNKNENAIQKCMSSTQNIPLCPPAVDYANSEPSTSKNFTIISNIPQQFAKSDNMNNEVEEGQPMETETEVSTKKVTETIQSERDHGNQINAINVSIERNVKTRTKDNIDSIEAAKNNLLKMYASLNQKRTMPSITKSEKSQRDRFSPESSSEMSLLSKYIKPSVLRVNTPQIQRNEETENNHDKNTRRRATEDNRKVDGIIQPHKLSDLDNSSCCSNFNVETLYSTSRNQHNSSQLKNNILKALKESHEIFENLKIANDNSSKFVKDILHTIRETRKFIDKSLESKSSKTKVVKKLNSSTGIFQTDRIDRPKRNRLFLSIDKTSWTLKYRNPILGETVELMPDSHIFVNKCRLERCKQLARSWKHLGRMLLYEIFTEEAVKKCSMTGKIRSRTLKRLPALNRTGIEALFKFVISYSETINDPDWDVDDNKLSHYISNCITTSRKTKNLKF